MRLDTFGGGSLEKIDLRREPRRMRSVAFVTWKPIEQVFRQLPWAQPPPESPVASQFQPD
jgi:hypothetical protein